MGKRVDKRVLIGRRRRRAKVSVLTAMAENLSWWTWNSPEEEQEAFRMMLQCLRRIKRLRRRAR